MNTPTFVIKKSLNLKSSASKNQYILRPYISSSSCMVELSKIAHYVQAMKVTTVLMHKIPAIFCNTLMTLHTMAESNFCPNENMAKETFNG